VVDVDQSIAFESGCDSSVECRSESVAGGQCSLNQRGLAEWEDPLDAAEKCLKTMAFRNCRRKLQDGEQWKEEVEKTKIHDGP